SLRDASLFTMTERYLLRGDNSRGLTFSDLHMLNLPNQGVTTGYVLVVCISSSKTNKDGRKEFSGAMRHKDARLC
ncbi:hypothetical protein BC829DRAFT_348401, partial [Chytridium lagenaria]